MHLACTVVVAAEALLGIPCPLTVWERKLRTLAGQQSYQGDFIANWVHDALFFEAQPWVFTTIYTAFALMVLMTFILAPPRRVSFGPFQHHHVSDTVATEASERKRFGRS